MIGHFVVVVVVSTKARVDWGKHTKCDAANVLTSSAKGMRKPQCIETW